MKIILNIIQNAIVESAILIAANHLSHPNYILSILSHAQIMF